MNISYYTISDKSEWVVSTPAPFVLTLPFYVTEGGHFKTSDQYFIQRDGNTGFLFIYTTKNYGVIEQNGDSFVVPQNHAVMIDCSKPHTYYSKENGWDFIWLYIHGFGIAPLYNILYPQGIHAVNMEKDDNFETSLFKLINDVKKDDVKSNIAISLDVHTLINDITNSAFNNESTVQKKNYSNDINAVLLFIKDNYYKQISLDDMVQNIHISKYHLIRIFRRVMGITPYHYLTNYRINKSKTLLSSTDKAISDIAFECGYLDTSQFIRHFKKHTGMKPLQYKMTFGQKMHSIK